jgi:hypothetical protein
MGAWSGDELKALYNIMCPKRVSRERSTGPTCTHPPRPTWECRSEHRGDSLAADETQTGVKWDDVAAQIAGRDVKACMNKVGSKRRWTPERALLIWGSGRGCRARSSRLSRRWVTDR